MRLRAAGVTAAVLLLLGLLGVGVASAVRDGGEQVVVKVMPGAGATAPAAPPSLSPIPRIPSAASGPTLSPEPAAPAAADPPAVTVPTPAAPSVAVGRPNAGRLVNGVLFPAEGPDVITWDAIEHVSPNRDWRRVGTDRLVRTILLVAAEFRRAHPGAPRLVVSDLSLPQGGHFGSEYGGLGHASHQNGLDVDIAYPRADRQEIGLDGWGDADRVLAQALVTAFVKAGAQFVFVGPNTKLKGPKGVVQIVANHDDHLHVRLPNR